MGLSVSAATAIIFAASVICFGVLLGASEKAQNDLVGAESSDIKQLSEVQGSNIAITDVNKTNGTVEVENTGNTVLMTNSVQIMLNGTLLYNNVTIHVIGHPGSYIWAPSEYVDVNTTIGLNGPIKVTASNGASTYYGSG